MNHSIEEIKKSKEGLRKEWNCCIFVKKWGGNSMAYLESEFKPTPMIFGAEGKRFLESTKSVKKEPKEVMERMQKHYEIFIKACERGLGKN